MTLLREVLEVRSANALQRIGVTTADELVEYAASHTEGDLMRLPNFGRRSLAEVKWFLGEYLGGNVTLPKSRPKELPRRSLEARARYAAALELRRSGLTFRAVGEKMGISVERARQLVVHGEREEARTKRLFEQV